MPASSSSNANTTFLEQKRQKIMTSARFGMFKERWGTPIRTKEITERIIRKMVELSIFLEETKSSGGGGKKGGGKRRRFKNRSFTWMVLAMGPAAAHLRAGGMTVDVDTSGAGEIVATSSTLSSSGGGEEDFELEEYTDEDEKIFGRGESVGERPTPRDRTFSRTGSRKCSVAGSRYVDGRALGRRPWTPAPVVRWCPGGRLNQRANVATSSSA